MSPAARSCGMPSCTDRIHGVGLGGGSLPRNRRCYTIDEAKGPTSTGLGRDTWRHLDGSPASCSAPHFLALLAVGPPLFVLLLIPFILQAPFKDPIGAVASGYHIPLPLPVLTILLSRYGLPKKQLLLPGVPPRAGTVHPEAGSSVQSQGPLVVALHMDPYHALSPQPADSLGLVQHCTGDSSPAVGLADRHVADVQALRGVGGERGGQDGLHATHSEGNGANHMLACCADILCDQIHEHAAPSQLPKLPVHLHRNGGERRQRLPPQPGQLPPQQHCPPLHAIGAGLVCCLMLPLERRCEAGCEVLDDGDHVVLLGVLVQRPKIRVLHLHCRGSDRAKHLTAQLRNRFGVRDLGPPHPQLSVLGCRGAG
mmetsp:Transcript_27461/g.77677  ORF Transcript_27461/g.77677 Transcript_27461/m.77677 type:complete len:369 (-) Transcript_27461:513-1619(-)